MRFSRPHMSSCPRMKFFIASFNGSLPKSNSVQSAASVSPLMMNWFHSSWNCTLNVLILDLLWRINSSYVTRCQCTIRLTAPGDTALISETSDIISIWLHYNTSFWSLMFESRIFNCIYFQHKLRITPVEELKTGEGAKWKLIYAGIFPYRCLSSDSSYI